MQKYGLYIFVLVSVACSTVSAQTTIKTTTFSTVRPTKLDTNRVVYDESGKPLRYYQYEKLVNSGEYTIRLDGSPSNPDTKSYLKRLSVGEKMEKMESIKKYMSIKSSVIKENVALDLQPLYNIFSIAELDTKIKVLVFWYADCPPCTESFESINNILHEMHNSEEVVTIAITPDSPDKARKKLKEKPLLYAKLVSNAQPILNAYDVRSFPSLIILDKNDVVKFAVSGMGPMLITAFKSELRSIATQ